jgi:hypothetical protein
MSDSEKILNEDDLIEIGKYLKDLVLRKCYWYPDKTFNEVLDHIRIEIMGIEFKRHYQIAARKSFGDLPIGFAAQYLSKVGGDEERTYVDSKEE